MVALASLSLRVERLLQLILRGAQLAQLGGQLGLAVGQHGAGGLGLALELADALEPLLNLRLQLGLLAVFSLDGLGQLGLELGDVGVALGQLLGELLLGLDLLGLERLEAGCASVAISPSRSPTFSAARALASLSSASSRAASASLR